MVVNFVNWRFFCDPFDITGFKYHDKNKNGTFDGDDVPIPNWVINLSGAESQSTATDDQGIFIFTVTHAGTYTVQEKVPSPWIPTEPAGGTSYTFFTSCGSPVSGLAFGNFYPPRITACKFNDLNGNGIKDEGEPPIANWGMTLTGNGVNMQSVTGQNGYVTFTVDTVGTFVITEETRTGWTHTTSDTAMVTVEGGDSVTARVFLNFCNVKISGFKFNDANGDGIWQNAENPLGNWTIQLCKDAQVIAQTTTGNALSQNPGMYMFSNVGPGTYTIKEVNQNGWTQTAPLGGTFTVIPQSCRDTMGFNFGNSTPSQFCTFTQGGWGTRPHGGNPGTIRDAHFAQVFPNGLYLGLPQDTASGKFYLRFTTSLAVQNGLPQGGKAAKIGRASCRERV